MQKKQLHGKIVFYHGDVDGKCAAAIVALNNEGVLQLTPIEYGYDSEKMLEEASVFKEVIFVDFCPTVDDLKKLLKTDDGTGDAQTVKVFDHHESAFNRCKEFADIVEGVTGHVGNLELFFDMSKAGCQIVWEQYANGREMPRAVKYSALYDIWDHSDQHVLPFQHGIRMCEHDPRTQQGMELWDMLINEADTEKTENGMTFVNAAVDQIINVGSLILGYKEEQDTYLMKRSFVADINGIPFLCVNSPSCDSYSFDSAVDSTIHKGLCAFSYDGAKNKWTFSLRAVPEHKDEYPVNKIAELFGGGGHPGAAGFAVDQLTDVFHPLRIN